MILTMCYGVIGINYEVMANEGMTRRTVWVFYAMLPVAGTITLISNIVKQKEFLLVHELMQQVDLSLAKYGIKISYRDEYLFFFRMGIAMTTLGILNDISISYTRHRSVALHIYELCCFSPAITYRVVCMVMFSLMLRMLKRQFRHINDLFVKMGCFDPIFDEDESEEMKESEDIAATCNMLQTLICLHQSVCIATKTLNKTFKAILLAQISVNILSSVIGIFLFFRSDQNVTVNEHISEIIIFTGMLVILLQQVESLYKEVSKGEKRQNRNITEYL